MTNKEEVDIIQEYWDVIARLRRLEVGIERSHQQGQELKVLWQRLRAKLDKIE